MNDGFSTYIHTDRRHTDIHTYIHTYRQTDRQTDRQTYIHTYIHISEFMPPQEPICTPALYITPCICISFQLPCNAFAIATIQIFAFNCQLSDLTVSCWSCQMSVVQINCWSIRNRTVAIKSWLLLKPDLLWSYCQCSSFKLVERSTKYILHKKEIILHTHA